MGAIGGFARIKDVFIGKAVFLACSLHEYFIRREAISDKFFWSSDFKRLSFVLGYKLIKAKSGKTK
jgi:hypothetical protein